MEWPCLLLLKNRCCFWCFTRPSMPCLWHLAPFLVIIRLWSLPQHRCQQNVAGAALMAVRPVLKNSANVNLKRYRRTRNATKTEAQKNAQREAERRKKQQQQRAAAAARNGNGPVASPLNAMAEILIGLSMGAIGTTSPITDSHTGSSMEQEQAGD